MTTTTLRPFNDSGYEILDDEIDRGEVVIWSTHSVTPRIGDVLLIESAGSAYDAIIERLTPVNGGWSACCRICCL